MSPLSTSSIYHYLLLACSILGLKFYGYFYCFHLFHIVVNNDILIRAVQSVTKNGASLLWVAALMVVVIYIYSQITFAFLRGDAFATFDNDDGSDFDHCRTAWRCFVFSLKAGLMSGGGLGEAIESYNTQTFECE